MIGRMIKRRMRFALTARELRAEQAEQVYRCSECGAHDRWGPGWLWYGTWGGGASRILCPSCSKPHRHEVITP